MITKYRTGGFGRELIKIIEVEKETDKSVWVDGRRSKKDSSRLKYHDTWKEAKSYLLQKAENDLTSARRRLEYAQGIYGNIKGLREPSAHS